MICPKCGLEIRDDAKFCTECGGKIESASEQPQSTIAPEIVPVTSENMQTVHNEHSVSNASNGKFAKFWNGLSLFSKIAAIAIAVVVILTIIALSTKTPGAIVFSILQLAGLVVAALMNNSVITVKPQWVKHIVLAAAILFSILNIASYTWGKSKEAEKSAATSQPSVTSQPSEASQPIVSDTPSSAASSEDTSVAAPPEVVENNDVTMDTSYYMYEDKDYQDVKAALEQLGFTNIKTEPVYDIVWGITKSGSVKSVSIGGNSSFMTGTVFPNNAEVIITYHLSIDDDPSNITMPKSSSDYEGEDYSDVEKEMKDLGFTNVKTEKQTTNDEAKNGKVYAVKIGGSDFKNGDSEKPDREVVIKYYEYEKPAPVSYSTNDYETAKKGNTGVFAYKSSGQEYSIYWIIDFDEGYVYYFLDGNGDSFCDRVKIVSGDLNSYVTITYHEDGVVWSERLHFKYAESPSKLIWNDHNGTPFEYSTTNLKDALAIRNTKKITDY